MNVIAAQELGQATLDLIEALEQEPYAQDGCDFFASVAERLEAILETIATRGVVSENQARALQNMHDGVARWQR
jgi:hypothetical protein